MKKKINILGTEYTIITNKDECENILTESGADGLMLKYSREIYVRDKSLLFGGEIDDNRALDNRYKEIVCHELVHAFLEEGGYDDLSTNENLVQFLACSLPKIKNLVEDILATEL